MLHAISHIWPYLPRAISAIVGFSFLYMALFMYQDQAGKIQNRLVNLWVRVSAKHEAFLGRQAVIIKTSSDIAELGLNWLLGDKLISLQFVVISFCMSIASLGWLFSSYLMYGSTDSDADADTYALVAIMVWSSLQLIYGLFAARFLFKKGRPIIATALFVVFFGISSAVLVRGWILNLGFDAWDFTLFSVGASIIGLVCDFVLLAGTRLILRLVSRTTANRVLLLGLSFSIVWLYILLDSTLVLVFNIHGSRDPLSRALHALSGADDFSFIVALGTFTNLFNVLAASSLMLVILVVLFHRIFWPSAARVIYALYEWKIFANRTLQITAAVAFLSFAFSWVGTVTNMFTHK
jgi:hypothetical protein